MENISVVGIIRTMDDLGRVVIPKEIRKTMGVREGDKFSILTMTDGSIVLRKVIDNKPVCDCSCVAKSEAETKIVSLVDEYNGNTKVVKITAEQDKFLEWLIEQDFLNTELLVYNGYPEVEDLT